MSAADASREADCADQPDEGVTLADVLREAGVDPREVWPQAPIASAPQTRHERMAQAMRPFMQPAGLAVADLDDRAEQVGAWVNGAGRTLGYEPTWVRFVRPDLDRGALFVLHSPHPDNEAELIVLAEKGVLTRSLIVDVCRWAFFGLGLCRVVVWIPADRPDLSDLARRARFRFEGTARRFFRGTLDAQIWAMTGPDCPWIAPRPSAAVSAADMPAASSMKVH